MIQVWLALLGLMLAFGLVLAAQGALRRARQPTAVAASPQTPQAATTAVPVADALPASDGSTGTVALPALPIPPGARLTDSGVVAARPFAWGRTGAIDRARAMQCLTAAIYYEAGGESIEGQRAVAQVVLNRARHPAFPATVCGVVYQGVERSHCQFSFACDGALSRTPAIAGWSRAAQVAAAALSGGVYAPVGLATHYHTFAVAPVWNRAMVMTDMVGAHLFHRWKGYWGTAAAMNRAYAGGEALPVLAPAPATETASSEVLPPAPASLPAPPLPGATPAPPRPSQTHETPTPAPPRETGISDQLATSGQILDKWKDSGRLIERPDAPRPNASGAAATDQRR
ncbi:cell wall hydrolase [Sphingomonas sanguinis]|uniref:cell wall hydrolase n=1 Tax=Sphingomonas sanguinis TaxID=33051 RepID=UPI001C570445|nr:cell wall hydrolase [Sphingomonas sanguinis]QXT37366.1 cell wall hydrolase [Sphingomonas sanguinis]